MPFEWTTFSEYCTDGPNKYYIGRGSLLTYLIEKDIHKALSKKVYNWATEWLEEYGEKLITYSSIQEGVYKAMTRLATMMDDDRMPNPGADSVLLDVMKYYYATITAVNDASIKAAAHARLCLK